jgi:hypothetical protein
LLEARVTHTKRSISAFDGYNRGLQSERTCTEVAKLDVRRRPEQGDVIALPLAAAAGRAPIVELKTKNRGAVVLQSETSSTIAAGKEWRRRESNRIDRHFSTSTCPILRDIRSDRFPPSPSYSARSGSAVAARTMSRCPERDRSALRPGSGTLTSMQALKVRVKNGRLVVDEPTDLPDGAEVEVVVIDDKLTPEERAELHASLDRASDDSDAGRSMDAGEYLKQYRARRENRPAR